MKKHSLSIKLSFLLIISICFFAGSILIAAPLSYMPTKITQPNGETVDVFASGDEFYNFLHDANGYTIILNREDGYYYYAEKSGDSLVAGYQRVRKGAEPKHTSKWIKMSERHYIQRVREFRKLFDKSAFLDTYKSGDKLQGQQFANLNNIVICIKFADDLSTENTDYPFYEEMYNSKEKMSLWKYYQIVSNGKINVETHIYPQKSENGTYGFYECENPRGYYEPKSAINAIGYSNTSEGYRRMDTLYYNAIGAIAPSIDTNIKIDENSDGNVDNVTFIFAGKASNWGSLFWPHMNALVGIEAYIHNKRVMNYNVLIDNYLKIKGVATACHEFLHSLGAPDFYDYTNKTVPIGQWELMSNTTNEPNQCGAYVRHKYLKTIENIPEITKSGRYTLNSVDKKENNCYKVQSYDKNQYYVLEFRDTKHILDKNMPMPGLLVYRVNKQYFGSSDSKRQELYIYRPYVDGNPNGKIEWAPFSEDDKRTEFNENTKPMPFLEDGSFGGLSIRNISEVGETMSFDIEIANPKPNITFPTNSCYLVPPKFTIKWKSYNPKYYSQVMISKDSNFNEIDVFETVENEDKFEVKLNENSTYYIRVRDALGDYKSDWSDIVKVKTLSDKHKLVQSESFDNRLTLPLAWQARESDNEPLWQVNTLNYGDIPQKSAECLWGKVPVNVDSLNFITLAKIDTNLARSKVLYLSIFKDINSPNLRLKIFQSNRQKHGGKSKLIGVIGAGANSESESEFERFSIQLDDGKTMPYIILEVTGDLSASSLSEHIYLDDFEIYAVETKNCEIKLENPQNFQSNVEPNTELSWSSNCKSKYEVQISENMDFSKIIYSEVTDSNYIKPQIFKHNRKYYWRVQGMNYIHDNDWSAPSEFTTAIKFKKETLPDSITSKVVKPNSNSKANIVLSQFGKYFINNRIMNSNDILLLYSKKDNKEYLMGYVNIQPELGASITVYADNPDTDAKDGFSKGESYVFKVWDSEMKVVRSASHNVFIGRDVFEANSETIIDVVNGLETNELVIPLETGWNFISSNIDPSVNSMLELIPQLKYSAIFLDSLYNKLSGETISKTKHLDYRYGYYLHLEDRSKIDKLVLKGDAIPKEDKFIKVYGKGWHLIPYLRNDEVRVDKYFGKSINSNIVIVKDAYGNIYFPPYINTLKVLKPGRAYLVYTSASISVDYKYFNDKKDDTKYNSIQYSPKEYTNSQRLKNLCNYAVVHFEVEGGGDSSEIAVTLGTDKNAYCVGNATIQGVHGYAIVSGSESILKNTKYQVLNGAKNEDKLHLYAVKNNAIDFSQELEILTIYDALTDKRLADLRFSENGVYKVKVRMPNSSVKQKELAMLYPNPANNLVHIDLAYSLDNNCEITMRDANSRIYQLDKSKIRILLSGIEVDISSLPAGTYFFELRSGELSKSYKFFKY